MSLASFREAPPLVTFIAEALNVLLGLKPDWKTSVKLFKRLNFFEMLLKFDKESLKRPLIEKLTPYVEDPRFDPVNAAKQSMAAGAFCKFVRAMYHYGRDVKNLNAVPNDIL